MSLKITNLEGFTIGGVSNPSITEIYVRANISMCKGNQRPFYDSAGGLTHIEIYTEANVTLLGGVFEDSIQVDYIYPIYWTKYSVSVTDMNILYLEIEVDLKLKLIEANPEWEGNIEIVTLGV